MPEVAGIVWTERVENDAATGFHIYRDGEGRTLLRIDNGRDYLITPKNLPAPKETGEVTVLRPPFDEVYLAASAVMAYWNRLGELSAVRFTSTKADDWKLDAARGALDAGKLLYVGKYGAPDYELLLTEGCDLAVESMMITHAPKTLEKLEALGIPVLVDYSSYEREPLGRLEWIRVYGLLTGREDEAERFYLGEKERLAAATAKETDRSVAFFYLNAGGNAVIRGSGDYIPRMIELAGGRYAFSDPTGREEESASPSVTITMEEFYRTARDADVLIYNSTINDSGVQSLADLVQENPLFNEFRAVRTESVWITEENFYQASDETVQMILDMRALLTDEGTPVYFRRMAP